MVKFSAFADEIGPDLDLQMDTCEANGVKCIDVRGIDGINVANMTLQQASEYKKRLDDRGFEVPCIGSPLGKINMDDDFEEHLDLLKHCIDVARAFGTNRIRMFSFYPSPGKSITDQRKGVMDRLSRMAETAEMGDALLYHENEKAIYGAVPCRVKDIFETIGSDRLKGIFDPANYVEEGIAPYDEGWTQGLAELTHWFHIKDKDPVQDVCVPAGDGQGQFPEIFRDLKQRGYDGYMTLEPHLAAAGQFTGHTGPELFAKAVNGLKSVCNDAGLAY